MEVIQGKWGGDSLGDQNFYSKEAFCTHQWRRKCQKLIWFHSDKIQFKQVLLLKFSSAKGQLVIQITIIARNILFFHKSWFKYKDWLGRGGGGQVVSLFAFYSDATS